MRRSCGAPKAERSKGRRTSSCARATHGDERCGRAREAIRREAEYYRASGADVIDIGCTPGREFPGLGDVVRELVGAGMRVSIDSFDPGEIGTAVAAGAELVLSINGSNREVARELAGSETRVVVIPDFGQGLEKLEPRVAALEQLGVSERIDPAC